jgi:hypothetical protein
VSPLVAISSIATATAPQFSRRIVPRISSFDEK